MLKDTVTAPRVIRMTVEYDGSRFCGWQFQKNARSVQHELEQALSRHLGHHIRITAAGRTDQGVHAMGQVISFKTHHKMPIHAIERGLFAFLPRDISVKETRETDAAFDARRSARLRWYRYFVISGRSRPAIARNYLTHIPYDLNLAHMRDAAQRLAGNHDFQAFRASSCTAARTSLTMQNVSIKSQENGVYQFDFRCRSFLQNQVRIMAGCIVACGRGKMRPSIISEMLASGVRPPEAITLQPNGLFLWKVFYEGDPIPTAPEAERPNPPG